VREAATHAAMLYRGGRTRFYVALTLLVVFAIACAALAVVYPAMGAPDATEAMVTGATGAVAFSTIAIWGVRKFSEQSRRTSDGAAKAAPRHQRSTPWLALLVVGALLLVAVGIWQLTLRNSATGLLLIGLAVANVVLVEGIRRWGDRHSSR
jgi:hypothetical protein